MPVRVLSWLIVLVLPAVVMSQTPAVAPQPAVPPLPISHDDARATHLLQAADHLRAAGLSDEADRIRAIFEKQRQSEEQLHRLIISRDVLTQEIQRLREITGMHQQVVTHVKVCELSLTKARNANLNVDRVEGEWLRANGFRGALSAGVFDLPGKTQAAVPVENGRDSLHTRVIDNDGALQRIVTELKQVGALKVLAEPTLVTISGRPASFRAGGEFPIPVPQANGDSTIEFREYGTHLDLVPVVLGEGRIRLEVRPRVSEIDADHSVVVGDLTVPGLRVRAVDTAVEMGVGQTLVLAGLVQQRAMRNAGDASGEAGNNTPPAVAPSDASADSSDANQDAIEEIELIVLVRAEFFDALTVARRAGLERLQTIQVPPTARRTRSSPVSLRMPITS